MNTLLVLVTWGKTPGNVNLDMYSQGAILISRWNISTSEAKQEIKQLAKRYTIMFSGVSNQSALEAIQ